MDNETSILTTPMIMASARLDGKKNWGVWKFQVKILLKGIGIFDVVDGTKVKPRTEQVKGLKIWMVNDAKAQSQIVSRTSEKVLTHLLTCETAA